MMRLEGKIAIVTGAGQGIGQAIAFAMAKEGANVVVNVDKNLEAAKSVVEKIKSMGRHAQVIKADISSGIQVNELVKKTLDIFKRIDILVNNAGIDLVIPTVELTEAQWDNVINVNLKGTFLCCQAVARQMIKQNRGGKIINIASIGGHVGIAGKAAYGSSKAGVLQLTRVLAVEWAKYNININSVSPGLTMTPMAERGMKFMQGYLERIPKKRAAKPEEIANAVLFLVSSEADFITGQEVIVDGGITALHPGIGSQNGSTSRD